MGSLVHRFGEFMLRYASRQDILGVLDGRGQFNERDVVVVGVRSVLVVGHDSLHFIDSFIAVIHQHVELAWRNVIDGSERHQPTKKAGISVFTQFDVEVARFVHAVGGGQDDVLVEDGPSTEPPVVLIHEDSLRGPSTAHEMR